MRVFLKIEYDGTNYAGWQIQPNALTVQEVLEKAVETVTGARACVVASGRTDSGVHAAGQVAHFDTDSTIPPEKFSAALNAVLPPDVKIISSERAKEGFHARFSAKKKTYAYKIYISEYPRPLKSRYAAHINYDLNAELMNEAAGYLVGKHDFRCFLAANSEVKDTVREIYSAEVVRSGDDVTFTVTGNGFLYNMVRIIAGTLVKVGAGKLPPESIKGIISSGDRAAAGATMPPEGLTLVCVDYD